MSRALSPEVQAVLRAATISEDGLTLTLAGELDHKLYQATAKAIEALGGKWNRKVGAHLFPTDARQILAGVLDGDALPEKNPLAFFPTPETVVTEMLKRIWPWPNGSRFLEPSAGEGAIADLLRRRHGVSPDCVELDEGRAQALREKGHRVVGSDFLAFTPEQPYDYVLMNPPFTVAGDTQAYIDHIEHALTCLRPGGALLAVAPGSLAWLSRKRVAAFREFCEKHAQSPLHEFAPGVFKASGTEIATCLIHLTKPEEAVMPVAEQTSKPRKSSKKPETAVPTGPVDFKTLAEQTRAKMQESKPKSLIGARASGTADDLKPSLGETEEPAGPTPVPPILDGSASSLFRVEQLVASPLNPRKFFDPAAIEELAESVLHKGLMQNLVGRVAENGQDVEIVAGGRRLRALKLLAEQGRISADYLVPVRVQPLSDLEALQLATAENVERRNMTPLEEADAFAGMVALGATPGDIALRFGYNARTVQQRLVLAEGLGEDGRELFNAGQIGLGQAQVIAQTTGPLRKHVLSEAKRGVGASGLTDLIKRGSFLVEHAKFDVDASGLDIVEDLFASAPARFADPQAALALQMDWVKARADDLQGRKEHHFVEVQVKNSDYLRTSYDEFSSYDAPKKLLGTVILVSSITGQVKEERTARRADIKSHQAKQQAEQRKQVASEASGSEGGAIRKSGWVDGHAARAAALRTALLGDHKRAVALSILTLLSAHASAISVNWQNVEGVELPEVRARLEELDTKLGGALKPSTKPASGQPLVEARWAGMWNKSDEAEYTFLTQLLTLSLEELLDLLGILTAQAYGNWDKYSPEKPAREFPTRLAADVRATVKFKLTDEHLKAYTRDRLLELAANAGLAYIAGNTANLSTNKDIRAAILQHADELHARGYVPPLARFPEVVGPDPADVQYRADAKALVLRLNGQQLGELLEELGHDPTDQDTAADALGLAQDAIDDMDDEELRDWALLKRLAQDLGSDATATAAD